MSEMMSEEISRVMTEQRELELEYARLIEARSQLKGLSHKEELQHTKNQINEVAKRLKESTKTLQRVLKDNPDVDGNQRKIKDDREQLIKVLDILEDESKEKTYTDFLLDE